MNTHTAGKWINDEPGRIYATIPVGDGGGTYALVADCNHGSGLISGEDCQANASLIVSAVNNTAGKGINPEAVPDMLEALEHLLAVCDTHFKHTGYPATFHNGTLTDARAAIERCKVSRLRL